MWPKAIHNPHNESEPTRVRKPFWTSTFNMIGGVSGLLAIALVIWRGGGIERQVNIDASRIDQLETIGSPNFRMHERSDDERVRELSRRIGQAEELAKQSVDLKIEVRVLGSKLDNITKQLEDLKAAAAVVKIRP